MKDSTPWIVAGAATVVVGTGLGGFYWYQQQRQAPPSLHPPVAAAPPMAPADAVPVPQLPAIQHPIEAAQAASEPVAGLPPVDQANGIVESALIDLLGRKPVLSFLDTDGFVRRVVASVDNLPSKHASVRLWPVQPVGGRLVVEQRDDGVYLGAGNAARYEPFIRFVESVDTRKAVALYVRMYPLFQQAYEELGYPGRYFNDRLVEVIDHLLATPDVVAPVKLKLPEVAGPVQPSKPWLMYEAETPEHDARSAGQKLLLRMGRGNAQRLKAKLVDLRRQIARADVKRVPLQAQQQR